MNGAQERLRVKAVKELFDMLLIVQEEGDSEGVDAIKSQLSILMDDDNKDPFHSVYVDAFVAGWMGHSLYSLKKSKEDQ